MKQQNLTEIEYGNRKWKIKHDEFLEAMDEVIPWEELVALIEPHYYAGKRGRPRGGARSCCGYICCRCS